MTEMSVAELKRRLDTDAELVLLDVREPHELQVAAIAGARHIPLGEIPERHAELPIDRPIAILCHAGVRSARACVYLAQIGYTTINVAGGIDAWSRAIDPSVPRY